MVQADKAWRLNISLVSSLREQSKEERLPPLSADCAE